MGTWTVGNSAIESSIGFARAWKNHFSLELNQRFENEALAKCRGTDFEIRRTLIVCSDMWKANEHI